MPSGENIGRCTGPVLNPVAVADGRSSHALEACSDALCYHVGNGLDGDHGVHAWVPTTPPVTCVRTSGYRGFGGWGTSAYPLL
jgi:hypothetical protein